MSEALPDNAQGPIDPGPEARPPITPTEGPTSAWTDAAERFSRGEDPADVSEVSEHRLTLERGGRSAMTDTAERIGSAVGSAQRQMRRGIELVRRPVSQIGAASSTVAIDAVDRANQAAHAGVDRASRAIEDIEDEIRDSRREAARRLNEWSQLAGERFQEFRDQARRKLFRSRQQVQVLADAYPLQTIAAVAGMCFVVGVALRIRRPRRG